MHVGFIVTKTPSEESFNTFSMFINMYMGEEKLSVYLLGNGVYCAVDGHSKSEFMVRILENSMIYACLDDLKARGIREDQLIKGVEPFESYENLVVALMEEIDQVLSF